MYKTYEPEVLEKLHKVEMEILKDFISICNKYEIDYFAIAGTAIGTVRNQGMIPWDDDIDIGLLRKDYEKLLEASKIEFKDKYQMVGPDSEQTYYNLVPNMSRMGTKFVVDLAAGNYEIGVFMDLFIFENIPDNEKEAEKIIKKCQFYRNLYVNRNINFFKFMKNVSFKKKIRYIAAGTLRGLCIIFGITDKKIYEKYKKYALAYTNKTNTVTILGDPFVRILCLKMEDIYPLQKMKFEDIEINMVHNYDKMLKVRFGDYMTPPPADNRANHYPYLLDLGKEN